MKLQSVIAVAAAVVLALSGVYSGLILQAMPYFAKKAFPPALEAVTHPRSPTLETSIFQQLQYALVSLAVALFVSAIIALRSRRA